MKFKQTGLPEVIGFGNDITSNESILNKLSYYTLCRIADVTYRSNIYGMAIFLQNKTLNLDSNGNFKSIS